MFIGHGSRSEPHNGHAVIMETHWRHPLGLPSLIWTRTVEDNIGLLSIGLATA